MYNNATKPSESAKYFDLFPEIDQSQLPEALRSTQTEKMIREEIASDPGAFARFLRMSEVAQRQFIEFCMGNRGLQITYDPFFKKIFNKERLEQLISNVLGQRVTVVEIMPSERYKSSVDGSTMIMDVIVKLEDGTIVDVEIQKISHKFPIERAVCYSSDILARQYDILKSELKGAFKYSDMRPVYVIVFFESAISKFSKFPNHYMHTSIPEIRFDTGLVEEDLRRFVFVSLDIFKKMQHNDISELEAWLYFLSSDNPVDISKVITAFPEFKQAYQEINDFRKNPKELLAMVSDVINIMDQNAFKEMIEDMQEELSDKKEELLGVQEELSGVQEELSDVQKELSGVQEELLCVQEENARLKDILEKHGLLTEE